MLQQTETSMVERQLKSIGHDLPPSKAPVANYLGCKRSGDLLYVSGQIGLVRAVVRSPQAHRHLIERSYTSLLGRAPSQELVEASLKRLRKSPASFFQMLVEWATPPA